VAEHRDLDVQVVKLIDAYGRETGIAESSADGVVAHVQRQRLMRLQ